MFHDFIQNIRSIIEVIFIVAITAVIILYIKNSIRTDDFDMTCSQKCVPNRHIIVEIDNNEACLCDEGHGFWRYALNNS